MTDTTQSSTSDLQKPINLQPRPLAIRLNIDLIKTIPQSPQKKNQKNNEDRDDPREIRTEARTASDKEESNKIKLRKPVEFDPSEGSLHRQKPGSSVELPDAMLTIKWSDQQEEISQQWSAAKEQISASSEYRNFPVSYDQYPNQMDQLRLYCINLQKIVDRATEMSNLFTVTTIGKIARSGDKIAQLMLAHFYIADGEFQKALFWYQEALQKTEQSFRESTLEEVKEVVEEMRDEQSQTKYQPLTAEMFVDMLKQEHQSTQHNITEEKQSKQWEQIKGILEENEFWEPLDLTNVDVGNDDALKADKRMMALSQHQKFQTLWKSSKLLCKSLTIIEIMAHKRDSLAQLIFGILYATGTEVELDFYESLYWLNQATMKVNRFTEEERVDDKQRAIASNIIGDIYYFGWKTQQANVPKAKQYYKMAAGHQIQAAQRNLAIISETDKDYRAAKEWYQKADNDVYSQTRAGEICYQNLGGLGHDYRKAKIFFEKAVAKKKYEKQYFYPRALFNKALMLYEGKGGMKQDKRAALKSLLEAHALINERINQKIDELLSSDIELCRDFEQKKFRQQNDIKEEDKEPREGGCCNFFYSLC